MFVIKKNTFSRRSFLAKEVSGRTVQLDEITKSRKDVDRTSETESVPEVIRTTEPEVTTPSVVTSVKIVTEPRRSARVIEPLEWFHNEIFILEEDESVHYR